MYTARNIPCILLCILLCNTQVKATTQPPANAIKIEGTWNQASKVFVVSDAVNKNLFYVAGTFSGTISVGTLSATSRGLRDGFVVGFERPLKPVWMKTYGGGADDSLTTIIPNSSGGFICAMACGGATALLETYTIDGITLTGRGSYDAVIIKANEFGALVWARNDGDVYSEIPAQLFQEDDALYVAGNFYQRSRFDKTVVSDSGTSSVYIQKLASNGSQVWVRQTFGVEVETGYRGLAVSPSVLARTTRGLTCVVGMAGGVRWGEALFDSVSATQPYLANALIFDDEGANQNLFSIASCNADSVVGAGTFGNTLVTAEVQRMECSPTGQTGIAMQIGDVNPIQKRFQVGGSETEVSSLRLFAGTKVSLVGCVEGSVRWDPVTDPTVVTSSTSKDAFISLFAENGRSIFSTLLGASTWARATDVSTTYTDIIVTALFTGEVQTTAGTSLQGSATSLGVFIYYAPITSADMSGSESKQQFTEYDSTIEVYQLSGEFVGQFQRGQLYQANLASGVYLVRDGSTMALRCIYK